ncbi:hypothetical protein CC1G_03134 [Coprinopsis cinerea okayama7|uniref:Hypervirulence associated protein TUDOR domain-containing protein n=1 Tax=Coprinopsis cinerea (strain Okayama-7 / 130 / ATCC MYA-4618 / FGSC 9003) TaxID=240176 RepID=A8PF23_COPC7|nr:hypothetical protein CC1G_03134 [Coprinopsis cinerea okayama7\|eukprot:XP_001840905.2 hypothetical protein CC1G_03134 [Coprinopsis cinerea okayama7\
MPVTTRSQDTTLDKHGKPIHIGETVSSRVGNIGRQYGTVEDIASTQSEVEEAGVKNPPKVLYTDQHDGGFGVGHDVNHEPEALVHGERPS